LPLVSLALLLLKTSAAKLWIQSQAIQMLLLHVKQLLLLRSVRCVG
jgi:hypothetical protein